MVKIIFVSVNQTRLPKDDHLPGRARRDDKVTKGDGVEHQSRYLFSYVRFCQ